MLSRDAVASACTAHGTAYTLAVGGAWRARKSAVVPVPAGTTIESQSPRVAAYEDASLTINPSDTIYEVNGVNRFLPLPEFQEPYFVFRDEMVVEQGGQSDNVLGSDLTAGPPSALLHPAPYVLAPFEMGQGRHWVDPGGEPGDGEGVL